METIYNKRLAFTLAEVLITLGIIGIVAVMTIPVLMNNSQKQSTVTRLQKAYNTINQAVKMSELENGTMQNWGHPASEWDVPSSKSWWDTYFLPYANLSIVKRCSGANVSECWEQNDKYLDGGDIGIATDAYYLVLKDGTTLILEDVSNTLAIIWIDINGLSKPNIAGKDIFRLVIIYPQGKINFDGYDKSRTYLVGDNDQACNKKSGNFKGMYCGALIQTDGWQIKDDYPW